LKHGAIKSHCTVCEDDQQFDAQPNKATGQFETHLQGGPILMNTLKVSEGFGGR